MSDRFSRQRGLVRQDVIEHLGVFMQFSEFPVPFVEAMKTLGEHLGAPEIIDSISPTSADGFQIEWVPTAKQEPKTTCLHVSYGAKGIFLNGSSAGEPVDAVYEPAIATVAACLMWSEILRRSDAYQPIEIPKVSVSVNVRVNENSLRNYVPTLKFSLDGHSVHQNVREANDGTMHKRVLLRLDDDDPLVQELINKLNVQLSGNEMEPRTPTLSLSLPRLSPKLSGHLSIVGAGGLGTWCLHTLVEGLKHAEKSEVQFLVFDKDMNIEEHNLNRQVIYGPEDVGLTKIAATRRWLERCIPDAQVEAVYELTDAMALPAEDASEDGIDLGDLFEVPTQAKSVLDDTLSVQGTIEQLASTDMILGCLDAMRPRFLANCIAAMQGVPYLNGGVAALEGAYHQFTTNSLIEMYGPNAARDTTVMSCQEDGSVPLSSIVLTNAFVGAFQALAALQRLSGYPSSCIQSAYWNAYENEIQVQQGPEYPVQSASVDALSQALWPGEAMA
ncbi:MAG: ThiF family adenylyltransferase [Candidatus Poseidoniales archaeon]|nr:MAG: ThiF family adenylyltransferase [Candidatus Poseidoniales archaeon]